MRFSRFNNKFEEIRSKIEPCMLDTNTKFCLVVVTTGQQDIGPHAQQSFDDLLAEMNDPTGLVTFRYVRQGALHNLVSQEAKGNPINVDVVLYEWSKVREPFSAYYGQIAADEVGGWCANHHSHLFTPNLRVFLGATYANSGIIKTVTENPDRLWYFNNGVTAICDSIRKKPLGGDSRDSGIFECTNLRVVNGAQTIGSIYAAMASDLDKVAKARLPIRIVSLEDCPPDFSMDITRATNTQNRIELRDFATLDDNQQRISSELFLDGIAYVYKSGESVANPESASDFVEAIVALACSREVGLAVQAKREISRLWEDVAKPPYKSLFNPSLTGRKLWRLVQIQRAIDDGLRELSLGLTGRDAMVPIHGNRISSYIVYSRLNLSPLQDAECEIKPITDLARAETPAVVADLATNINEMYPESYLASLFKNRSKCESLVRAIRLARVSLSSNN